MRIQSLRKQPHGQWGIHQNHLCESVNYDSPREVVEHHMPFLRFNMQEVNILNELTYKDIAGGINGAFLNQKVRADALDPIEFIGMVDSVTGRDNRRFYSDTRNISLFNVKSSEYSENGIIYPNTVAWEDWDEVGNDPDTPSYRDKALFLIWASNVRLNCTCESFFWWGYQYILTQLDASIFPVNVAPKVRNPNVHGVVCKHMNRVLRSLPFYTGEIAAEMQEQFGAGTP